MDNQIVCRESVGDNDEPKTTIANFEIMDDTKEVCFTTTKEFDNLYFVLKAEDIKKIASLIQ